MASLRGRAKVPFHSLPLSSLTTLPAGSRSFAKSTTLDISLGYCVRYGNIDISQTTMDITNPTIKEVPQTN